MVRVETAIQLLLVALVVALVTRWRRRPYTIALVIVGLVLGLLGWLNPIHTGHERQEVYLHCHISLFSQLSFEGRLPAGGDTRGHE